MMEKNKVRARLTPSRLQAPANDVALPGVPGDGGPEGCHGAPERTRPATGHRGREQLESSAVATGVVPCSSFRDGRWRGAPRLARDTRPPAPHGALSRSPPMGVAGRTGLRRAGPSPSPSAPAAVKGNREASEPAEVPAGRWQRGGQGAAARGSNPGLPGALPRGSSRESRQPLRGTKLKAPRQKIRR